MVLVIKQWGFTVISDRKTVGISAKVVKYRKILEIIGKILEITGKYWKLPEMADIYRKWLLFTGNG